MQSYGVNATTPGASSNNTGGTYNTSRSDSKKMYLPMQSNHASIHTDPKLLVSNKDMSFKPDSQRFNGPLNTSGSASVKNNGDEVGSQ